MQKGLKSFPIAIMKVYKDEIEHLLRNEEKIREMYAILRSNLPSIVRECSRKILNLPNLKESEENLISELILQYLKFSTLEDMTNVLFPKIEKVPEEAIVYIAKPIRALLANYLHKEIPRFPSPYGLEMILDFYKFIERIPEKKERERLKRGFRRVFRKHYTYTKDMEAEIEAWKEVGRRRVNSYVLRPPKAGEVSVGPPEIMKVVKWMKKVNDSFEFHEKAKNIGIRIAEIIINSKPIMSEYKLLLDLFNTHINPEELNEKTILDLGCGCKSPLIEVIEKKGIRTEVIALDDCKNFLKISKETFPNHNYLQANFPYTLPFVDNAFDYIFAICSMHFNNRIEKYSTIAGLHQLLKKGGKFFIVHPRSQKVSHLETKQYLESLGYKVREEMLKVNWVGLKPSYFYLLIAEKTLQINTVDSYIKGIGMSYLKAAKNRNNIEEKTIYLLRASEIAENYGHTLEGYFKKIEELEGINVEKRIKIPKFEPPKLFVKTHQKLLSKLKKWLKTYPEEPRCKDFIIDLFQYREREKCPWVISINEVRDLAANHYISWEKTHQIMLDLQEIIRKRDGFLGWPTDTIIVSLGNLARLLGLSARNIYEEAQNEYIRAKEEHEQRLKEQIKSLPRLRID